MALWLFLRPDLVEAFSVQGKLVLKQQNLAADVPIVLLKLNSGNDADGPPMFPVSRTQTDSEGAYLFENLNFEVGTQFQLGVLIKENRLGSEIISYQGQDILFDFKIDRKFTASETTGSVSIQGKVTGNLELSNLESIVFLQAYSVADDSSIITSNISQVQIDNQGNFEFSDIELPSNSGFKIGINYKQVPILGALFFVKQGDKKIVQNLTIPKVVQLDSSKLVLKRHTLFFELGVDSFEVSEFLAIVNPTNSIVEINKPFKQPIPTGFYDFSSNITDATDDVMNKGFFNIEGPFFPGERVVLFSYRLKRYLGYKSFQLLPIAGTELLELVYNKKNIQLSLDGIDAPDLKVEIGDQQDYYAKQLELSNYPNSYKVIVVLQADLWEQNFLYLVVILVTLVLIFGLVVFFVKYRSKLKNN